MSKLRSLALALTWLPGALGCESKSDTTASGGKAAIAGQPSTGGSEPQAGGSGAVGGAGASGGDTAVAGSMSGSAGSIAVQPDAGVPIVLVASSGGGVRVYDLNKQSGALTQRGGDYDAGPSPSYLALDPARTHLYVSSAEAAGGVAALGIGPDGELTLLGHQTGSDGGFAHLAVDPTGKHVVAASFEGGGVSVFPVAADGMLLAEIVHLDFGDGARAHAVAFDEGGQHVLVPTLGLDRVQQLLLAADGTLSANTPAFASTPAGAGPRHIAIHPTFELAFVINEVDSTVTPFQLSAQGTLAAGTSVSTLPASGFAGENTGAHIEVSPDGRFVYASNRGHDSIVVYAVEQSSGALTLVEHEPTRGLTPRDFDVDPKGETLIVANQESDNLSVYAIEQDGTLTPLGTPTPSGPSPRCVQFHYLAP
jgi:6-phosphogluconolactonase